MLATGPDVAYLAEGEAPVIDMKGRHENGRPRAARLIQNAIVVPLRVHAEVVGSLNLMRVGGPEAHFSEHDFELAKLFADQASMALQNAEAHLTVASRAALDALTGLRNHGTFQRDLSALIEAGDTFALLMMDLDSFKAFNDTYGHPAGDSLLRAVAQSIVGATRQVDRAYRYGGDEFALLLVGADPSHADEVASRIRTAVRGAVRHLGGPAARWEVSACVGVAHWPADGRSKADLVRVADHALYAAKSSRGQKETSTERRPETLPIALFEAATDLIASSTFEQIAEVTLRHAGAIVGSPDGFVALVSPGARRPAARMPQFAGSGEFLAHPVKVTRTSLWGRAAASGKVMSEEASPREAVLAIPLVCDGQSVGLLGLAGPEVFDLRAERLSLLTRRVTLAATAARRAIGAPTAAAGEGVSGNR